MERHLTIDRNEALTGQNAGIPLKPDAERQPGTEGHTRVTADVTPQNQQAHRERETVAAHGWGAENAGNEGGS